jgi:hypothetical protein
VTHLKTLEVLERIEVKADSNDKMTDIFKTLVDQNLHKPEINSNIIKEND